MSVILLSSCSRSSLLNVCVSCLIAAEQVLASIRLTRGNAAANSVQACWGGRL